MGKRAKQIQEISAIKRHFLKLLAVIFSVLIWFYVLNSEPQTINVNADLVILTSNGVAVSNMIPTSIKVKMKGPRVFIRNLKKDHKVYIDIKKIKNPGLTTVEIKDSNFSVPFGVDILKIIPSKLDLILEKKIKKLIPVIGNFVGKIDSKYHIATKEFSPAEIMISGPYSVIKKTTKCITIPIELNNLQGEKEVEVSLTKLDQRIGVEKDSVFFSYEIKPKSANFVLKNIPIRFLTSRKRYKSSITKVSLSVLIPDDKNFKINKRNIQVIADIPDSAKGRVTVRLKAVLPENVHLLSINPSKIVVKTY